MISDDEPYNGDGNSNGSMPDDDMEQQEEEASDYDSEYAWEEGQSDGEVGSSTKGMDLAKADADALNVDVEGMFAKVEAHTPTLIRLWVCVEHSRLFEGLATRAVEALGLDPSKDVMVMFTTDQDYTGCRRPKVQWARQVDPVKSKADDLCPEGRIGEIFPLQGTLCQKLDEDLTGMWHRAADRTRVRREISDQLRDGGGNGNGSSVRAGVAEDGDGGSAGGVGDGAAAAVAAAATAAGADGHGAAPSSGGSGGEAAAEPDSSAVQWAIESICETTGASRELVAYTLMVSKYDEHRAHLTLQDDGLRSSLEKAFGKFQRLKDKYPFADEALLLDAVAAHPRSEGLRSNSVRRSEEREDLDARMVKLGQLAEANPLARAALTIMKKLRNANKDCLVCDEPIEGFLPAVPIVCPKEFCRWRSEQMGCGTDVESQVLRKGETVDLLIDLFWMAMHSGRSELAFPATVQSGTDLVFKDPSGRNDVDKVQQVLRALPTVADMQRCIKRKRGEGEEREDDDPQAGETTMASATPAPPLLEDEEARQRRAATVANASANAAAIAIAADNAAAAAEAAAARAAASDAAAARAEASAKRCAGAASTAAEATAARARATTDAAQSANATAYAANAAQAAATAAARAVAVGGDVPDAARFGAAAAVGGDSCFGGGVRQGGEGHDATDGSGMLSLEKALTERNPLAYRLLRWLLSANRAHLRPLREWELIPEIPCQKQFTLVTGTAEREARFQALKREAALLSRGGTGTGSFYAFHGSGPGNWHGILQEGLKNMSGSRWMSTGAAMGSGIYMANQLSVSLGYAGGRGGTCSGHWPNAERVGGQNPVIVAVCEVIDRESYKIRGRNAGYYVVPDEECVATRFLLINPRAGYGGGILASCLTINVRT
ncbi:unnamed protein product [Ectocarpus sp. CCAP 1310/34]|nr:unnamed protein product [Ectocarpus sp. CCAP 1310/34]